MTLLGVIVFIVVVGVIMWLLNTYVPMQQPLKTILNVFVVIVVLVILLGALGLFPILNQPIRQIK